MYGRGAVGRSVEWICTVLYVGFKRVRALYAFFPRFGKDDPSPTFHVAG